MYVEICIASMGYHIVQLQFRELVLESAVAVVLMGQLHLDIYLNIFMYIYIY